MKFSTDEQETTIVFSRNENKMIIYTSDKTFITKLKRKFIDDEIEILTSKDTNGYGDVTKLTYTYYLNLDSIYINQLNTSIHKYEYFIEDNKE